MTSASTSGSTPEGFVLDAWALMAFFLGQSGGETVKAYLRRAAEHDLYLHASVINFGEAYYMTWKKRSQQAAIIAAQTALLMPVEFVPVTPDRALRGAEIKARYSHAKSQLSYADCLATALAEELSCPVLTGDPEFRQVESLVKVIWLRELPEP